MKFGHSAFLACAGCSLFNSYKPGLSVSAGTSAQPRTDFPLSRQGQMFREETLAAIGSTSHGGAPVSQRNQCYVTGGFLQPIGLWTFQGIRQMLPVAEYGKASAV